jgi:hypothetical protein
LRQCKIDEWLSDLQNESLGSVDVIHGTSEDMIQLCVKSKYSLFAFPHLLFIILYMDIPEFLLKNHEIGHYSGYQTRVFADYFSELIDEADILRLSEIYKLTLSMRIPFLIIGGGTNILFATDRFA